MSDEEALYRLIGERIRAARERVVPMLSQAKLAKQLGISRASVVNIEGGHQRAPLHLLWRIARALDAELSMLIPLRAEMADTETGVDLNAAMRKQIKLEANGNAELEKSLTSVVGKLLTNIEPGKTRSEK
jgi:transcriptional regulator with XRE-family HTH domain